MALSLKIDKAYEQQRHRKALLLTLLISFFTFLGLYLYKIHYIDTTQIIEYGMEVTFGTDDQGSGKNTIPIESAKLIKNPKNETTTTPENKTSSQVEEIVTNETSETNVSTKKETKTNPTKDTKDEKKTASSSTNQTQNNNNETSKGKGNDENKTGNKGKTTGINQEGLYEGKGGSGGSSLNLAGWKWEREPIVVDNSRETGTITFLIQVDENGDFITVKPIQPTTVSASVVNAYREAVLKAILTPESSDVAPISKGTITFVLKSK